MGLNHWQLDGVKMTGYVFQSKLQGQWNYFRMPHCIGLKTVGIFHIGTLHKKQLNWFIKQPDNKSAQANEGSKATDFVPISWTIPDSAYADLNKYGIKDAAIILQQKDSVIFSSNVSWKRRCVSN